ncbi:tail fiber protein [Prochlorococcus phage P-SSP3]|uniref:Peptidase S74 domain-containing protein n=2 Tax=Tritonvirus TaxID=2731985 RepID=M1UGX0_9CAUD|nr:tail fiber protein [Cyanophage P-SSP2]YP_007677149.1 tail fiber protein [Prochlorococcus phage P-SSP3]ADP00258.1 predicted protein [Cyanophage P-SSP2]AGG54567.1 hypothetical protein PRSG_00013 [Prochlorococcus phage P-SSP3]
MALTQITEKGIKDGEIINADINASAAIAGTKISPNFGSQNIQTTGGISNAQYVNLSSTSPSIDFVDTNNNSDFMLQNANGVFKLYDSTNNADRVGVDSSGNVGIGTSSPAANLHVHTDSNGEGVLIKSTGNTSNALTFDANRGAEGVIAAMYGRWNGTTVAQMSFVSGSDTTDKNDGFITFGTESAASNGNVNATERMRIASDGKVGINIAGTDNTSPVRNLDIADSSGAILRLISSDDTLGANERLGEIEFFSDDDDNAHIGAFIKAIADPSDSAGRRTALTFGTQNHDASINAVEKLRIDANGNVGIGTTSPNSLLNIHGVFETNAFDSASGSGGRTSTGLLIGDAYSAGKTSSDDRNSIIWNERGLDIDFATSDAVRMKLVHDGRLRLLCQDFSSDPSSSNSGVMLGSTSTGSVFSSGSATNTQTHIIFRNGNGDVGTIQTSGSSTAYNTSSDYRLKENAVAISDGITRLKTLKPYRFNFKADADTTVDGFFAHEVTAVPEAISGTKDETKDILYTEEDTIPSGKKVGDVKQVDPVYQGIDQSKIVPLLTAALQEAVAKIETLETKVAALEAA